MKKTFIERKIYREVNNLIESFILLRSAVIFH